MHFQGRGRVQSWQKGWKMIGLVSYLLQATFIVCFLTHLCSPGFPTHTLLPICLGESSQSSSLPTVFFIC